MAPRFPPPAHRRGRGPPTAVADGHAFSAVDVSAADFSTGRKKQFLPFTPEFGAALGMIPSEFRRDLLHNKTKVPGLSCGVISEILRFVVLIQYRLVTDGQTDGHAMTANTKYSCGVKVSVLFCCEYKVTNLESLGVINANAVVPASRRKSVAFLIEVHAVDFIVLLCENVTIFSVSRKEAF